MLVKFTGWLRARADGRDRGGFSGRRWRAEEVGYERAGRRSSVCSWRRDRRDLAYCREPLDPRRQCRPVGLEEPVLCILPVSRLDAPFRRLAVLEPISLWWPSECGRSAIADLRAAVRVVGAHRPGALVAGVRPHRVRTFAHRRALRRRDRMAGALAARGLRARGSAVHVRRRLRRPAPAHRHHCELWLVSAGVAALAACAPAPFDLDRGWLCADRLGARARPQPGGTAAVLRSDRSGRG